MAYGQKEPLKCKLCGATIVGIGYFEAIAHGRQEHREAMLKIQSGTEEELIFCDENFEALVSGPQGSHDI